MELSSYKLHHRRHQRMGPKWSELAFEQEKRKVGENIYIQDLYI